MREMKKSLLILLLFAFAFLAYAQTIITGTVKDDGDEAISGAIIKVKDAEKTVAFAITKSDGNFKLSVNSESKELQISASMMSYAIKERVIDNVAQTLGFVLKQSPRPGEQRRYLSRGCFEKSPGDIRGGER